MVGALTTEGEPMSVRLLLATCLLVLPTACGDDGGSGSPDAPKTPDGQGSSVMAVTCPANPAMTITTQAQSFSPATASITVGSIVKLESTANHPIGPFPGGQMTDPALVVPETQTKCFQFNAAGTFKFICTVHQYLGTITVN
jgi:plastocyanin